MQRAKSEQADVTWHSVSAESSLEALETSTAGLDQNEVGERLAKFGANRLPEAAKRSALIRFLQHFHNILIFVTDRSVL